MSATDAILAEFDLKTPQLEHMRVRLVQLLEDILRTEGLAVHDIQSRVKSRESLAAKCERPTKAYRILGDLTDVIGFRVITFFEDDVDRVASLCRREFTIDSKNSVDKRQRAPDQFGYLSLHYVCEHSAVRAALPENAIYNGIRWEIQIRSILQHAWAEIEHDIGYKSTSKLPDNIKRRLNRLAGLLEIADEEFREIRQTTQKYRQSVDLRLEVDEDVSDLPLDSVSLRSFVEGNSLLREVDTEACRILSFRLLNEVPQFQIDLELSLLEHLGVHTVQSLRDLLEREKDNVLTFVRSFPGASNAGSKEAKPVAESAPGISIFHIALLLSLRIGVTALERCYEIIGIPEETRKVLARSIATNAEAYAVKHNIARTFQITATPSTSSPPDPTEQQSPSPS